MQKNFTLFNFTHKVMQKKCFQRWSVFCLMVMVLLGATPHVNAQIAKDFKQRSSIYSPDKLIYQIQGDFALIGNTNMEGTINEENNTAPNYWVDIDGDNTTTNSSRAKLTFSTERGANPECTEVVFAGLYWSGRYDYRKAQCSPDSRRVIKFKHENGTYQTLTAAQDAVYYPTIPNNAESDISEVSYFYGTYVAYVEVTDIVKTYGEGNYYCADIPAHNDGPHSNLGVFAGWSMVVIYENSSMKWRDITLFDGFLNVKKNNPRELPISGFLTVQAGNVNVKLGVVSVEGDRGIDGDQMQVLKADGSDWTTLNNPGSLNNNNFFASRTFPDFDRRPHYTNNKGIDIVTIDIPNENKVNFKNKQASTRFKFYTTGDTYMPFLLVMGTDAFVPDARVVDAVLESESVEYDPVSNHWVVDPGDTVSFMMRVHNYDDEDIENASVRILLPVSLDFLSMDAEYTAGRNGTFSFDPTAGHHGTAVWTIDRIPAGYPDSVWATFYIKATITKDCYALAANPDCDIKLVLNGTLSGTSKVTNIPFTNDFIQGFEDAGMCRGNAISEDIVVHVAKDQYISAHCDCNADNPNQHEADYECYKERKVYLCDTPEANVPLEEVAKYYEQGTRFYNFANPTIEYTYESGIPLNEGEQRVIASASPSCESTVHVIVLTHDIATLNDPMISTEVVYCLNEESNSLRTLITRVDSTYLDNGTPKRFNHFPYVTFYSEDPRVNPDAQGMLDLYPPTNVSGPQTYYAVQRCEDIPCYASEPIEIDVTVNEVMHFESSEPDGTSCKGTPVTFTPRNTSDEVITTGSYSGITLDPAHYSIQDGVLTFLNTAPAGKYSFNYVLPEGYQYDGDCTLADNQMKIEHEIVAKSVGGIITPDETTICNGSSIPTLTLSGYVGEIQFWEYYTDNGNNQKTISSNINTLTQSKIDQLAPGRYIFRAWVTNGECASIFTEVAAVRVLETDAPAAPTITPNTQNVCVGESFNFGTNNANYRWYTSEIGGTPDPALRESVMGNEWQTRYVSQEQTVSGGTVCESARTLVVARPTFISGAIDSTDQVFCEGTDALQTIGSKQNAVIVEGQSGTINYKWYMETGGTKTLLLGATSATLNPNGCVPHNDYGQFEDGIYLFTRKAYATNGSTLLCDTLISSGVHAIVIGAPDCSILSDPANHTLCAGVNTSVTLKAAPTSKFNYQWYKDESAIEGANKSTYTATAEGQYKVEMTSKDDPTCTNKTAVAVDIVDDISIPTAEQTEISETLYQCELPDTCATIEQLEAIFGEISDDATPEDQLIITVATVPGTDCLGSVERTYTVTDLCDNNLILTHTITLKDTTRPAITGDIALERTITSDNCTFQVPNLVDEVKAISSDNCTENDELVITQNFAANSSINLAESEYNQVIVVTVKDKCGNERKIPFNFRIPAILSASISTTDNKTVICENEHILLSMDASGGDTESYLYTWTQNEESTPLVNTREYEVSPTTTTTYVCKVEDAYGCTATDNVVITVHNSLTVQINPPTDLCPFAGSYPVSATVEAGTPSYTYTWTGATGATENAIVTEVSEDQCGHEYTVKVKVVDINGCEATDEKSFTTEDNIDPTIGADDLDMTLTSTNCVFTVPNLVDAVRNISSDNCTAKNDLIITQDPAADTQINPEESASTTTVKVTVKDKCGNENFKEIELSVPARLTAELSTTEDKTTICEGELIRLEMETYGGTEDYTYSWKEGAQTIDGATTNTYDASPVTTTHYHATVKDANGCEIEKDIPINVKPVAHIDPDNYTAYIRCNGDTFSVKPNGLIPSGTKYMWTTSSTGVVEGAVNQDTPVDSIKQALTNKENSKIDVTYVVTPNTDGCLGDAFNVVVSVEPTPTYNIQCGDDVVITLDYGECMSKVGAIMNKDENKPFVEHSLGWKFDLTNDITAEDDFMEGENFVTWKVVDSCGNEASCQKKVTVNIKPCPEAIDYEGNVYPSKRIGCDCWLTKNLTSTKYSDGSAIESIYQYKSDVYPNEDDNVARFGRLYTWLGAIKDSVDNGFGHVQGICPEGWYLPTNEKYQELNEYGVDALRSSEYWLDGGGNNSTGFSALPSGYYDGSIDRYINLMGEAYFWSTTEVAGEVSTAASSIHHGCGVISDTTTRTGLGYSVRCVKEKEPDGE